MYDIVLIGCGLHGVMLLSSDSNLFSQSLAIVERGRTVGPGAFLRYPVTSNSYASKFFDEIRQGGVFDEVFATPELVSLTKRHCQAPLPEIARGLAILGDEIARRVGRTNVFCGRGALCLSLSRTPVERTQIELSNGGVLSARAVILATGRKEFLHPSLERWASKVVFSSEVMENKDGIGSSIAGSSPLTLAIAGASHAAFSVIESLTALNPALVSSRRGPPAITLVHREDIPLYYRTADEATREQIPGTEQLFDPRLDVCPETGAVFRDSGLRVHAKTLYRNIRDGLVTSITLRRVTDLEDASALFDDANFIVQALGAKPALPKLFIDGLPAWRGDRDDRLELDFEGRVLIPGHRDLPLFGVRLIPTPASEKNHRPAAHRIHHAVALAAMTTVRPSQQAACSTRQTGDYLGDDRKVRGGGIPLLTKHEAE